MANSLLVATSSRSAQDANPMGGRRRHLWGRPFLRALGTACLVATLNGCGSGSAPPPDPHTGSIPQGFATDPNAGPIPNLPSVLVPDVPHVLQKPDFCGEAATEMVLRAKGISLDQDAVFALTDMDPARGMGATTRELSLALTRLGFDVGPVYYTARRSNARQDLGELFQAMHADLSGGVPSIVCSHFDERPNTTEHFRLVVGYDHEKDEVIYSDPAIENGGYLRMGRIRFLGLWPLKYRDNEWTVIRMRLSGVPLLQRGAALGGFSKADYAQHVHALKPMLAPEFSVVIEPPFVVVGNESKELVEERARTTVRWAVEKLKKDFFNKDPGQILTVWLFGDKKSYDNYNRRFFSGAPKTPYGYYSPDHKALVMNIGTGGGTLVHEIVHPFMETNVPACPSWLNEGLGSLFEQSADRAGHIVGLTNWRLAGLQRAISAGKVPSFKTLLKTSRNDFYDDDPGTNYSQSRYLLYYLQEHGLLTKFWTQYLRDKATDESGYSTLLHVLNEEEARGSQGGTPKAAWTDLSAFQKRWEAYVLGLTFP